MKNRIATLPGTPHRFRMPEDGSPEDKLDFDSCELTDLIPERITIEIAGGRSCTASAMRSAMVQRALERVGGAAESVALEGGYALLDAEADRTQVLHLAKLPFVKRISRS